jgi:hypothetical protein
MALWSSWFGSGCGPVVRETAEDGMMMMMMVMMMK